MADCPSGSTSVLGTRYSAQFAGKELVARFIRRLSGRPAEKLHAMNYAGLPRDLAESLLFGHRKGSFTSALADQKGTFELAEGSQAGAARLLRVTPQAVGKYLRKDEEGHFAAKPKDWAPRSGLGQIDLGVCCSCSQRVEVIH